MRIPGWSALATLIVFALADGCGGGALATPRAAAPPSAASKPAATTATVPDAEPHGAAHEADGYYAIASAEDGASQSPVNILRARVAPAHHAAALHYAHASALCVKNKGHTVEVEFPEGSTVDYDGKRYRLVQAHFHTPSEHQLDGVTYPMEMHIVHVSANGASGAPPEYLVVSVLFRMGAPNPFIAGFLDAVPARDGAEADLTHAHVFIDELFPDGVLGEHFHYHGSLTTPPYTETVEWLVLEHDLEASPEQIERINRLEGNNARHIHALSGRTIEMDR